MDNIDRALLVGFIVISMFMQPVVFNAMEKSDEKRIDKEVDNFDYCDGIEDDFDRDACFDYYNIAIRDRSMFMRTIEIKTSKNTELNKALSYIFGAVATLFGTAMLVLIVYATDQMLGLNYFD